MIALLALALAAAGQPRTVLTVDRKHRLIEGIASDGRTIWVSSVLDRQILACRRTCRTLARMPAGLYPFAIAWDGTAKRLWVAADCPPGVKAIKPCKRGALIGLSPTGKMISRLAPEGRRFHPGDASQPYSGSFHPGDVSAGPGGAVFVSDSQNGAVFQVAGTGWYLAMVLAPNVGKSAQGTALAPNGKRLLVADYSQGIGTLDIMTGERKLLPRQDGKALRGIDGLTRCGSVYYGIYNGATPGALVSIVTNWSGLTFAQPLHEDLPDPTQVAYDGKRLLIVADSGWATIDKPDFVRTSGAPIVAVPLTSDCKVQ
jgi:hypothetical protein